MSVPEETLWSAQPHTLIKHTILKGYLDAWYPILGRVRPRLVYLDGFAGPGEYEGGEPGSPIIALTTFAKHSNPPDSEVVVILVEKRKDRHEHLEELVEGLSLPERIVPYVLLGEFEDHASALLADPATYGLGVCPSFAFVDPFGFSGLPLNVLKKLIHPFGSELFVSLMVESMMPRVFHEDHKILQHLDKLFGTHDWREAKGIDDADERRQFLKDLYEDQLKNELGVNYVRTFEMRDERGVQIYQLVFATNGETGVAKMKEAMWNADPGGSFIFSDATDPNQTVIFTAEPDYGQLRKLLINKFQGTLADIEEIKRFVELETPFLAGRHLKKDTLKPMEQEGLIEAIEGTRNRKLTYPDACRLRFLQVER